MKGKTFYMFQSDILIEFILRDLSIIKDPHFFNTLKSINLNLIFFEFGKRLTHDFIKRSSLIDCFSLVHRLCLHLGIMIILSLGLQNFISLLYLIYVLLRLASLYIDLLFRHISSCSLFCSM
jgi:hypothetical protein